MSGIVAVDGVDFTAGSCSPSSLSSEQAQQQLKNGLGMDETEAESETEWEQVGPKNRSTITRLVTISLSLSHTLSVYLSVQDFS